MWYPIEKSNWLKKLGYLSNWLESLSVSLQSNKVRIKAKMYKRLFHTYWTLKCLGVDKTSV